MKIKIGDNVKIPPDKKFHPEKGHLGKCVWISQNGKTVAIQCSRGHDGKKNVVFLVDMTSGNVPL